MSTHIKRNIKIYFLALVVSILVPIAVFADNPSQGAYEDDRGIVPCNSVATCDMQALGELFVNVIQFALGLGLIFSAIAFAWAGILYLTARGDSGKVEQAHNIFGKVIVGFIIALSSFVIVDMIAGALGLDSTIKALFNSFV